MDEPEQKTKTNTMLREKNNTKNMTMATHVRMLTAMVITMQMMRKSSKLKKTNNEKHTNKKETNKTNVKRQTPKKTHATSKITMKIYENQLHEHNR